MASNLDETELARLEALAGKASTLPFEDMAASGFGYDEMTECSTACNAVPALVAEVRRLREALNTFIEEDQSRVILVQQQMLDCLREKVEAWEWLEECRQCMEWLYAVCWETTPVREAEHSFLAAARAVHADRE